MKWIFILVILSQVTTYAGNSFGNGGDAVVCRDAQGSISQAQLLDHYEYQVMDGGKIDLGSNQLTEIEKVELILNQMRLHNPTRAFIYSQGLKNFYKETKFVQEKLDDIDDSGDVILPRNCFIEQLAVQLACKPGSMNNPHECSQRVEENYYNWDIVYDRYKINKSIWDKLDVNSKAGLILHELIYREAANILQHTYSISVRKINSQLSSGQISKMSQAEYNQIFLGNQFGSVDIDVVSPLQKITFFVTYFWNWGVSHQNPVEFYDNSVLKSASPHYTHDLEIVPLWIDGKMYQIYSTVTGHYNSGLGYQFNQTGDLLGLDIVKGTSLFPLIVANKVYAVEKFTRWRDPDFKGAVTFHKKGTETFQFFKKSVKAGRSADSTFFTVNKNGELIEGHLVDPFQFTSPNYSLKSSANAYVSTDLHNKKVVMVSKANGWAKGASDLMEVRLKEASVRFNEDGNISSVRRDDENANSSASGKVVLPDGTPIRFNDYYSSIYNGDTYRSTNIEFGAIEEPLVCIFKNVKYKVKSNLILTVGFIKEEPIKVVQADELNNILNRHDFCEVIKE